MGKNNLWSLIAKAHDGSPNNLDFGTIEDLFCQQNLMNGQASPRLSAKNGRDSLDRKKRESSEVSPYMLFLVCRYERVATCGHCILTVRKDFG